MNDKKSNIRKILPAVVLILLVLFAVAGSDWFWNALSPITYKSLLYRNAGIYKVDPLLVAAIIKCESTFNPMAVSSAGAVGLMQLMRLRLGSSTQHLIVYGDYFLDSRMIFLQRNKMDGRLQ